MALPIDICSIYKHEPLAWPSFESQAQPFLQAYIRGERKDEEKKDEELNTCWGIKGERADEW